MRCAIFDEADAPNCALAIENRQLLAGDLIEGRRKPCRMDYLEISTSSRYGCPVEFFAGLTRPKRGLQIPQPLVLMRMPGRRPVIGRGQLFSWRARRRVVTINI
jgi:hypothetical protein